MPAKYKTRSVGVQSTDSFSPAYEPIQNKRLYKRAGFKNLLQQSVTIIPQENTEGTNDLELNRYLSKAIQTDSTSPRVFHRHSYAVSGPERQIPGHSRQTSYLMNIDEQEESNPGTSSIIAKESSIPALPQLNDKYFRRHESSLVVVYDGGEKSTRHSLMSGHPHLHGSQGSRRFSDETVLLTEDYHSYDERNIARRQEVEISHSRSSFICCFKKTRRWSLLRKPLPLYPVNSIEENDEIFCRICHEGAEVEPLMQPCLCKGSVGSVHAKCLKAWLEQSNTSRCELCNYPYSIRQTKKYSTCVSIRVFYKSVFDKRATAYDVTSFIVITPLTLVGVVMCIRASLHSRQTALNESNFQMSYVTRVGMVMLCGTIIVAYLVWLYTLASFHFKSWRKWYNTCYDVEVIPVQMTSEERLRTAREFNEEMSRISSDPVSPILTFRNSSFRHSLFGRATSLNTNTSLLPQQNRYMLRSDLDQKEERD